MCALKVGIVGAGGQVGLAMLRGIQSSQITAVGICRNHVSAARVSAHDLDVRIAKTDDPKSLSDATRDLDAIVNCALPQYRPSRTSAANRRLSLALSTACKDKHLVHLSSVAVYGDMIRGERKLFRSPQPDTNYGRQKLQMESLLRKHAAQHSATCTILRVGHVYGSELRWSESIINLIHDDSFRLPFDGKQPSNAISIDNLIAAVRKVLLTDQEESTLNATNVPQISWRDLFDLHSQACSGPIVQSLRSSDSEACSRDQRRRAQTGMPMRFIHENLAWLKRLPASYLASVPTLKSFAQQAVAWVGSDTLDGRLWAFNWRHLAPRIDSGAVAAIEPIFFSEPVPGPCVSYEAGNPAEVIPGLRAWHAITAGRLGVSPR